MINKFLLKGDKCKSEMYLKESRLMYGSCEPFPENKERIQKGQKIQQLNMCTVRDLGKSTIYMR